MKKNKEENKVAKKEDALIKSGFIHKCFNKFKNKVRTEKNKLKENIKTIKNMPKKELFTKIFSSRYFIVFLFFIILLKTILFYADTVFYKEGIWLWSIRQTSFFIIFMVSLLLLCRRSRVRFVLGMLMNLGVSILLFADELYYLYASNIISVMQAGNLQYGGEIMAAIPSLLKPRQILYFIDILIIIICLVLKVVKVEKHKEFLKKPVIIMTCILAVFCTYYHFIPESLELVTGYIYNKKSSVRYGTIYGYHVVDVVNAITNNKNIKYDTYKAMIKDYNEFKEAQAIQNPENVNYNGIANGKTVIILQLEAVQEFVIDKKINGKEITPNLNKFKKENINITNMHSTSYTTTADSEHSTLNSLYPMENGEAFSKYYGNTYDDVFNQFKDAGYYTMYAHGNWAYFWNRENVFSKYPVDDVMFLEQFEDKSELIRTYLADELLYRQTLEKLNLKIQEGNSPIIYDLVAASSHKPFELAGIVDKYSKVSIDVGDLKGTELGNYLEAVNYADYAFGIFIDLLKEYNLYDDVVLVVHGDHYGMQMYDENLIEFLGYDKNNYNDAIMQHTFSNVVCAVRIPGISNITIDAPTSKNDVKPTLAQICGLEDAFSMGTSIFNRNSYVTINNGKVITDKYLYDGAEWLSLKDGNKVNLSNLSEEEKNLLETYKKQAITELDISNAVMVNNLLQNNLNKEIVVSETEESVSTEEVQ